MLLKVENDEKSIEYLFTTKAKALSDFTEMCHFHQTSPDSHFTQNTLISKPNVHGRITLSGTTLKITEKDSVMQQLKFAHADFGKHLQEWFGFEEWEIRADR